MESSSKRFVIQFDPADKLENAINELEEHLFDKFKWGGWQVVSTDGTLERYMCKPSRTAGYSSDDIIEALRERLVGFQMITTEGETMFIHPDAK